jgi:hypothetical protein
MGCRSPAPSSPSAWALARLGGVSSVDAEAELERRRAFDPAAPGTTLGLAAISAGGLVIGALVVASLANLLLDATRQPSLAALVPGAVLVAAGWMLLTRGGTIVPRIPPVLAGAVFAGVSLLACAGLLAIRVAAFGAAGIGPFEQALLGSAVIALLGSPLLVLVLRSGERAAAWLAAPAAHRMAVPRGELLLLAAILLLFALIVVRLIAIRMILGFDESIYALTTRAWMAGTPNTGWAAHRSPGISILGLIPWVLGGADAAFRVIGLLFALGGLVVAWGIGRRLAGPAAGLLGALAIACIPDLQLNASLFLTDVPSTALVLLLVFLSWRAFEERTVAPGTSTRLLLLLAPVAAAAFYVRYGASLPILFVAVAALLAWPRRAAASWRGLLLSGGLLGVLLLPHLIEAARLLGSPWAIALSARNLAAPDYPGQALGVYWRDFFSTVAGPFAGTLAIAGPLALLWRVVARRRWDRLTRAYLFLLLPAVAVGLILGEVALAQTRYIYVPLVLLAVAGAVAVAEALHGLRRQLRLPMVGLAVAVGTVIMLASGVGTVASQAAYAPGQRYLIEAAEQIRADALRQDPGSPEPQCAVLTYLVPEVTWYSGCAAYHFSLPPVAGREELLRAPLRYLLLLSGDRDRQPQGALLDYYLALVEPQPFATVPNARGQTAARIYRFRVP